MNTAKATTRQPAGTSANVGDRIEYFGHFGTVTGKSFGWLAIEWDEAWKNLGGVTPTDVLECGVWVYR